MMMSDQVMCFETHKACGLKTSLVLDADTGNMYVRVLWTLLLDWAKSICDGLTSPPYRCTPSENRM